MKSENKKVKMKSIVIYDSYTGNTKKIAEVIAETLKCKAKHVKEIDKNKVAEYDLVVIGTPVHAGMPSKKIKNFLKEKRIKKFCAVFCTYGVYLIGNLLARNCLNYMKRKIKAKCIGKFKCPGFYQIMKIHKGRPNKKDLKNARKFAESLKEKS
jgi:flavodoxin